MTPVDLLILQVITDQYVKVRKDGSLHIERVRLDHMGDYTCLAENVVGVYNHTTTVNVYGTKTHRAKLDNCSSLKCLGKCWEISMAIKCSHFLWIYNQITVRDFLHMIWKQSHTYFKHVRPTFKQPCAYCLLVKHHTMRSKHFFYPALEKLCAVVCI